MLIETFVLKVINNDRKSLTDHEIIDRIAEQIELVITQENEKPFKAIKNTTKHKNLSQIYITGRL